MLLCIVITMLLQNKDPCIIICHCLSVGVYQASPQQARRFKALLNLLFNGLFDLTVKQSTCCCVKQNNNNNPE